MASLGADGALDTDVPAVQFHAPICNREPGSIQPFNKAL